MSSKHVVAAVFGVICPLLADTTYFEHTFFDNSITPGTYYYSSGRASAPSSLELNGEKLPVDTNRSFTPPNALRLHWTSRSGGGWVAQINLYQWRDRTPFAAGTQLIFYVFSPEAIPAGHLPQVALQDSTYGFTAPLHLTTPVPAAHWTRIALPLQAFRQASVGPFDRRHLSSVRFIQDKADNIEHILVVDEVRIDSPNRQPIPPAPHNLQAQAFERHIDISWSASPGAERYIVYRGETPVGTKERGVNRFTDYVGETNITATYRVKAQNAAYQESPFSASTKATTHSMSDEDLLSMVQQASFRYYWEQAHPISGTTRENTPGNDEIVATGATGFGIMALVVAVDRGFISREQGLARLRKITAFLERADRFHGVWPHFLSGTTGHRLPVFDMFDNGADLVETGFLMEGLLVARQYFKDDAALHQTITRLWEEVEWDWFRRTPDGPALYWHWSPEFSWQINHPLYGWNEVMISYLLAIASPTHPVPPSLYDTGWAGDPPEFKNGGTYFGIPLALGIGTGGPLFFTHYSYMALNPHGLRDRYTDYFVQNRNMALINHAYCENNPGHHKSYGAQAWGLTAVDGPTGYVPYEPTANLDDGTIAPTGAISSIPYTPDLSLIALKSFYRQLGKNLWDVYGFRDAFNPDKDWFSGITMGLNQAPMIVMIENQRTGLIWKLFDSNPEIERVKTLPPR